MNDIAKVLHKECKDYPAPTKNWLKNNMNFVTYCKEHVQFKHPWHVSIFGWYIKTQIDQGNGQLFPPQQKK